jgi:glycosyltransferase involved in cell wall biosynthesis
MRHGNMAHILARGVGFRPDIYFYPHAGPLDAAFFWIKRNLKTPTAIVSHIVSGDFDKPVLRPAISRMLIESDAVFGNNTYLSAFLQERTGVNISTIHNGIDRRFFFPSKSPRSKTGLTVLYAGSLRPYKRVDIVVREATRRPEVEFRIAGIGEEEESCRRLAREADCRNISFLGHLRPMDLGNEMRAADIFFFPSVLEGHPQVLGQAAACGLPAVALNRYHPDYVVHGRTGYLAESHEEMGNRLAELLTKPDLRCSISAAAIEHAARFDWDDIARQWQDVFEGVVARRRTV